VKNTFHLPFDLLQNLHHIRSVLRNQSRLKTIFFVIMLISLVVSACSQAGPTPEQSISDPSTSQEPESADSKPLPEAEVTFDVLIPTGAASDDSFTLNVLDEVTGLALNALTYPMDLGDDGKYSATLKFPVGSVVKYLRSPHFKCGRSTPLMAVRCVIAFTMFGTRRSGRDVSLRIPD
jgi:hypothetical protein